MKTKATNEKLWPDSRDFSAALMKTAQYLAGLTVQQDVWSETGKVLVGFLAADVAGIGERGADGEITEHHWISSSQVSREEELGAETKEAIAEVLQSGFLTSRHILTPDPLTVAFLPVTQEHQVTAVLVVGHRTTGPLPKELLNVYLAIAGLVGTTAARLASEIELRNHRRHLEVLVKERTAELTRTNQQLEREIGERNRAEKELQAKNTELEQFTRTVSHDLRSPLVTIRGFLSVLEQDAAGSGREQQLRHDVERIRTATDWMQDLVNGLLELSRIGRVTNPPEAVPLGELARDVVGRLAGTITQRGFDVHIAPDLPVVFGDRLRLGQVLQNLIENAVKFTGNQPAPRIDIEARRLADETVCSVRDNGAGIEPGDQSKIFGLFARLDEKADGSGIGLALVKRIIETHGGRIWVESRGEGTGSAFCFALPDSSAPPVR